MGSWYAHIYNPVWPNRNPVKFPVVTYILGPPDLPGSGFKV